MLAVVKFLNCIIATTVQQQINVMSIITYKIIIQICPELGFILMIFGVLRRILCKRYSTNVKNGAVFCACAGLNSLGYRSPVQALQYARPQGVNAARACREAYSLGIR